MDDAVIPERLANFDCRNNRLAHMALLSDGFEAAVECAVWKYGAHRIGLFLGTSTSGILSSEQAYRHRDPTDRRPARLVRFRGDAQHVVAGRFRRALAGAGGAGLRRVLRLLDHGEGVRQRRPDDPGGRLRCRRRRRRRLPVPDDAVRLPFAGTGLARGPARPSTSTVTACRWGKPPASPCWSGPEAGRPPGRSQPARRRREQRRLPHVHASSRRARRPACHGRRADGRAGLRADGHRTTSTCTAPRRPMAMHPRTGPSRSCSAPPRRAVRPRAIRGIRWVPPGSSKPSSSCLSLQSGFMPGSPQTRTLDPALAEPLPARERERRAWTGS